MTVASALLTTHLHGPVLGLIPFTLCLHSQCIAWQEEAEEPELWDLSAASPWARGWCTPAVRALPAKSSQEENIKLE